MLNKETVLNEIWEHEFNINYEAQRKTYLHFAAQEREFAMRVAKVHANETIDQLIDAPLWALVLILKDYEDKQK